MGSVLSSRLQSRKRIWWGLSEHARLLDQTFCLPFFFFCVWVAFLQVKSLTFLWRCSSAQGCGAEYQSFQVLQRVFNITQSVPQLLSVHHMQCSQCSFWLHKDCWHEKEGKMSSLCLSYVTLGSAWHLQFCQRTSTSLLIRILDYLSL